MPPKNNKTEKQSLEMGVIAQEYGRKTMLSVNDASAIDKIRWSIVLLGTGGKSSRDFYMKIEDMRLFCREVASGEAGRKIEADKNNAWPQAYKWVTGENAEKTLWIGGGKAGVRIKSDLAGQKGADYMISIGYNALKSLADKFLMLYGLVPVTEGSYYADQIKTFNEGRQKRLTAKTNYDAKIDGAYTGDSKDDDEESTPESAPEVKQPTPVKNEPMQQEAQPDVVEETFTLNVFGQRTERKNYYLFPAELKKEKVTLAFKKEEADKITWFKSFTTACESSTKHITFVGEKNGAFVRYIRSES